jgi:hypothetical protein
MQHPTQICSLIDERTNAAHGSAVALDSQLLPAFIEGSVIYYPFKGTYEAKSDDVFPYKYVFFNCEQCGDGEEQGDGCGNCFQQGELMFELMWDESGVVSASKTL